MTISYPRDLPAVKAPRSVELRAVTATGLSRSPFTGAEISYQWSLERWEVDLSLPPMTRVDAEAWAAWILSLQGRAKTFLLGDPLGAVPRGSARDADLLTVDGAGQTGHALALTSAPASVAGYFKAGDYLQLGTGSTARLHKILEDAHSDGTGRVTVDLWPALRGSPPDGASVKVEGARGVFRLASNVQGWQISEAALYGFTLAAEELVT